MELLVAFNISYLVISCVLGILGNAIIIRVFKKRQTNVATDILIIALAVVDLMSSVLFMVPVTWAVAKWFRIRFNCAFFWLFRRAFAYASSLLGSVIAFDRYVLVCSPCKLKTSKKVANISVVVSYVFSFATSLYFGVYGNAVCVGDSKVCAYTGPTWLQFASSMVPLFLYFLALISCFFCYGMIYLKIRKHNEDTAYVTQSGINSGTVSAINKCLTAPQHMQETQELGHSSGIPGQFDLQDRHTMPEDRKDAPRAQIALDDDRMTGEVSSPTENLHLSKMHTDRGHVGVNNKVSPAVQATHGATSGQVATAKPRKKKDKMTKMMFIATVIYVLSSIPVLTLENIPTRQLIRMQTSSLGEATVNFLYQLRLINHIINIFVYYGVNSNFRRKTNALFGFGTAGN